MPATSPSSELLGTAADHARADVPIARREQSAGGTREALAGRRFDSADSVVVLDEERFVGIVPIERLLAAPAEVSLAELVDPESPVVAPGTDQERAAWRMLEHGELSVAVVDEHGRFTGLISPHRMLRVLLTEHDEDLARLGGYLASTSRARLAAQEPVRQRLWHRMPFLDRTRGRDGLGRDRRSSASSTTRCCSRSSCRPWSTWPTRSVPRPRPC